MAPRTGLGGSFGIKSETTWGTAVTVDEWLPFVSENVQRDENHTISKAIRVSRFVMTSDQWNGGVIQVGGPIHLELHNKNIRTLLKAMFGTETGASPYTYSPADNANVGFTMQIGKPDASGTTNAFTYPGTKISSWELSVKVGEIVGLTINVIAKSETTNTALASPSYPATMIPFKFTGATLSIAGSAVNTVREMSLSGDNKLSRRNFLGTQTTAEPYSTDIYDYTGTVTTDFESMTAYNRFVTGTEAAMVMTFARGTSSVVITMNVKFNGRTPNVSDRGVLQQDLPYMCVASSTDASAITVVYTP